MNLRFFGSGKQFLDRKSDAVVVESDDLCFDFLTDRQRFVCVFDPVVRDLRNVNKSVYAVVDGYECTVGEDSFNLAFDDRTDGELLCRNFVGFLLKLFVTERDFACFSVHFEDYEVVSFLRS